MTSTPFPAPARVKSPILQAQPKLPVFPGTNRRKSVQVPPNFRHTLPSYPHETPKPTPKPTPQKTPTPEVPASFRTRYPSPFQKAPAASTTPHVESKPTPVSPPPAPTPATDLDLRNALRPLLQDITQQNASLFSQHQADIEPMLRNLFRRTLAEQLPRESSTSGIAHLGWRLEAFMTGKSYDEVIFSKTLRYRVEESYLFERTDHILLTYASRNVTRHAHSSRVKSTYESLRKLIKKLPNEDSKPYNMPDGRFAVIRQTDETILVSICHGKPTSASLEDLDYLHKQVNQRFIPNRNNVDLLKFLQPTLESTLLIQSAPLPS